MCNLARQPAKSHDVHVKGVNSLTERKRETAWSIGKERVCVCVCVLYVSGYIQNLSQRVRFSHTFTLEKKNCA